MSAEIEGLQELIDKLSQIDEKLNNKMSRGALKEVAQQIKDDMKSVAPVSTERNIHGVDAIDVGKISSSGGYTNTKVGLSTMMNGDWEQIRGLWFQNFKTDEPNFGWFDNFKNENAPKYKEALKEKLASEIKNVLK